MAESINKKIEIISNIIRNKIPRLMEPNFSCKVITKENPNNIITICYDCYEISVDKIIIDSKAPLLYKNKYQHISKIIGKEPMLNDVLEWVLTLNNCDIQFNISEKEKHINIGINNNFIDIDLSKPYLKDWNEYTINFLFKLCQNQ